MPASDPEGSLSESPTKTSAPGLSFGTKIVSSSELPSQPWLSSLTQAINEGYASHGGALRFAQRLDSDTQLSDELGENGFTVVAYTTASDEPSSDGQDVEVIGTASVKDWLDDHQWEKYTHENVGCSVPGRNEDGKSQHPCDGDYEIAVVAVRPGEKYRKRGIADHIVKVCEQEILRRLPLREGGNVPPLRTMVRVVRDLNGPYWMKKGFSPVGQKWAPTGTWGSSTGFALWAMVRELTPMVSIE